MARLLYIILFSCFLKISLQRSTPRDTEYVAAVVEYQVSDDVEQNRLNYIQHIEEAARQDADIVVFPELTLTNDSIQFPVPMHSLLQQYPIPALHPDLYDNLLVSMSSAARNNSIYVVVNVRELLDCTRNDTGELCPNSTQYVFNTNVVFDRIGRVIDRYRKINLFGEPDHTPALQTDLGHFETDFGVTFTHFICFDLLFQVPSIQAVQRLRVSDVIFTSMWFSELPYLTAVQIQEAYAYAMNVNLIAAGANNVYVGSAGSGIYSGRAGALVSIMPGVPTTRLLVSRVPKVPGQVSGSYPGPIYENPASHDQLPLLTDSSLVSHVSRQLTTGSHEFILENGGVNCRFNVTLSLAGGESYPYFRAMAKDGTNKNPHREIGVAVCSIVACKTKEIESCGYLYNTDRTTVEVVQLAIEMTSYRNSYNKTLECDNIVYFPISVTNSKFPESPKDFTFYDENKNEIFASQDGEDEQNGGLTKVVFKLNKLQKQLVSFGIWGRIYLRDIDHRKKITEEDKIKMRDIGKTIYAPIVFQREKLKYLIEKRKKYLL